MINETVVSRMLSEAPLSGAPPNMTTRPRAASYAIACAERATGLVAGDDCVQVVPSYSQVSCRGSGLPPPNSTTRLRAESYASACPTRPGGRR